MGREIGREMEDMRTRAKYMKWALERDINEEQKDKAFSLLERWLAQKPTATVTEQIRLIEDTQKLLNL